MYGPDGASIWAKAVEVNSVSVNARVVILKIIKILFAVRTIRSGLCFDLIVGIAHRLYAGIAEGLAVEAAVGIRGTAKSVELRIAQVFVRSGTHTGRASAGTGGRCAPAAGVDNVATAGI